MLEGCTDVERIVVDASVVVKWFVAEIYSDRALRLMDLYSKGRVELIAPTLIYYEVANALRFHPYYRLTKEELIAIIRMLRNMQIIIEPTDEMWSRAFRVSISYGVSIYDAIYIAIALALNVKFVTSDEKLFERLRGEAKRVTSLLARWTEGS